MPRIYKPVQPSENKELKPVRKIKSTVVKPEEKTDKQES